MRNKAVAFRDEVERLFRDEVERLYADMTVAGYNDVWFEWGHHSTIDDTPSNATYSSS